MTICKYCEKTEKETKFHKNRGNVCNKCHYKKRGKIYDQNNREKIRKRKKEYYEKNKEKIKEQIKKYEQNNKEKIKLRKKNYHQKNKDKIKERHKKYYQKHKKVISEKSKIWKRKNKEKNNELRRKRENEKFKTDPVYKLNKQFSEAIRVALKGKKGGRKWESLVGYTLSDLKNHLESLFEPWMNWENHGVYKLNGPKVWNIDHIIPKSWFNYTSPEDPEFKECWALSNLQPKEAKRNIIKGNKFIG